SGGRAGAGRVQEHQQAGQPQVVLVGGAELGEVGGGPGGDGDDAVAGGELRGQGGGGGCGYVDAALQDGLRGALGDHRLHTVPVADEDGHQAPFVVEGQHRQPDVPGQYRPES